MSEEKKLTVESSNADFKAAYAAKRILVEREQEDFLFALGKQWSDEDTAKLKDSGITPTTDNRIAPNLFLLTGLERQNRTDFKAFPEGEEDGLKAEVASALFKDAIKKSGFQYKSSEQFKDGITCGESHLELYLDNTESLINGTPRWKKCDGDSLFPDPAFREYDLSDARYVYKLTKGIAKEDLLNLYGDTPKKRKAIEEASGGKVDIQSVSGGTHTQKKDYPKTGGVSEDLTEDEGFDLLERYYKKWVPCVFIGDKKTGDIRQAESKEKADSFIAEYKASIESDRALHEQATEQAVMSAVQSRPELAGIQLDPVMQEQIRSGLEKAGKLPPPPPGQDPERFIVIKRMVPEIWVFAHTPGIAEPLADERAWFYPKWKSYPFIPFFARFSTAPLKGDDRHLLVQGLVHGVKGSQEKHNKAETLMLRHLNTTTNSGWLTAEGAWVDPKKVEQFGTTAGVNLEYKKDLPKPERIYPVPLSHGHAQVSIEAAESIKSQLGINADLLATQQGGADSGRAIALRQRQGLLMVQELFDNLSRTRQIAGKFLLSQLGEIYDTETAMKVLGEAFMVKNFKPVLLMNPETMQQEPMKDERGDPMKYDREFAEITIAEVLSGKLGQYDVSVGESVSSETKQMANAAEIREIATAFPGIVSPDIIVRNSQLPESAKTEILAAIERAQALQAQPKPGPAAPPAVEGAE